MKIMKKQTYEKETPDKIFCNKCGNEIKINSNGYHDDFLEVKKSWGYFSFYDGETHSFDICQNCYNEFTESFKLPL